MTGSSVEETAPAQRRQHDRGGQDARPAQGSACLPRLPVDPLPAHRPARAIESLDRTLKADGTTLGDVEQLMTFTEFTELIGADAKYALAERFGAE